MLQYNSKKNIIDSIVLIEEGIIYTKSTAVLKIAKYLNNGLALLYLLIIIPKYFRDSIYNFIAKNRYRWFGKKDKCMIPSYELKNRFLN